MSFLKKKCAYCKDKIDKGKELVKDVKVPEFVGTRPKHFCSEEHARKYQEQINEKSKCEKGGSCCG